ncbi:MAG TPA: nucleotidyltransferase family protein [Candidatus Dormibacteraeota bacterium]|nr:nucleotidyltransferase family protein [Candidatus Dormibacteraeota bacterium]
MKAMILAAGRGTRLQPLTDTRPKALVEIAGRTLLEITLSRLRTFGVTEAIINVHHFADMVVDYLKANNNFGMRIEISREEILLDTGGGLKKAAWFFLEDPRRLDEPFFLHNVDVLSSIDLRRMLEFHREHQALATLAVQSRESSRLLLFNEQLELCGRRVAGEDTGPITNLIASQPLQALAFSGVHIISPRLLPMLREEGVFSIIPEYLRISVQGQKILGFRADEYYWRDLGRPADLTQATVDLQQQLI